MGTPADFGISSTEPIILEKESQNETNNATTATETNTENRRTLNTGKRLFRNTEDKIVGGVCSGLAAYFGINDPIWIRLAFAALFFGAGVGLPMYMLLLIIIPKAKTAADRLAMRGEPINVSNIARTVEQEMGHIKGRIEEIAEEFTNNQKKKDKPNKNAQHYAAVYTPSLNKEQVADFVSSMKKTIFAGGIGLLITILAIVWIGMLGSFVFSRSYFSYLFDNPILTDFGFISLFLMISLPIIGLILLFMKWFYKAKITRVAVLGIALLWLGSIASLTVLGASASKEFLYESNTKQFIPITTTDDQPLKIISSNAFNDSDNGLHLGHIRAQDNQLILADIYLKLDITDEPNYSLEKTIYSHGHNTRNAQQEIASIQYDIQQKGNTLELAPFFTIQKGAHWRSQRIELTLKVPRGKKIILDETVSDGLYTSLNWEDDENGDDFNEHKFYTHQWTASSNGFKCADCLPEDTDENADTEPEITIDETPEMQPEPDPTTNSDTL
jgi:phage shock protein C